MIAQIKRPREWTAGDWFGMIGLVGTLTAGAWWMSAQNSLLTAVQREVQSISGKFDDQKKENSAIWSELRSQDRRLLMQENQNVAR